MDFNRYAPPVANLEVEPETSLPLWNPNAAANWCLLFTPIFGSWLHMKNWETLGEPTRAGASRKWLWASIFVIVGLPALGLLPPLEVISRFTTLAAFVLLLSWYFGSARGQAKYVEKRFGKRYPRKGWTTPLLLGIGAFVGYIVIVIVAAMIGSALARAMG